MINIGIVTGSIRETRVNLQVAEWVKSFADNKEMEEVNFEILDIKETGLANFNETVPPLMAETYSTEAQTNWSEKVKKMDGFIFITPEYNKNISSALKDHLDYLGKEL